MPEWIISAITGLIAVGQILAVRKGQVQAVTYYLCVASLGYFSIWVVGVWDPARLCGVILIAGAIWKKWGKKYKTKFIQHGLIILYIYMCGLTMIGMIFWPYEAMTSLTPLHGYLRGLIQIINWGIIVGVAWQIALVSSTPEGFAKLARIVILAGVAISLYGIYQYVANKIGLPVVGIRRPSQFGLGVVEGEGSAAYVLGGERIFRVGSLVGEPKGLGAAIVFWLSLYWAYAIMSRGRDYLHKGIALLFIVVLWLTASTSAWIGVLVGATVIAWVHLNHKIRLKRIIGITDIVVISIGVSLLAIANAPALFNLLTSVTEVWQERMVTRLNDPLTDLAVDTAIKILSENSLMVLFGTGIGGMSFYIAEYIGGIQQLILFPNIGFIGIISDIGILGLGLLIVTHFGGIREVLSNVKHRVKTDINQAKYSVVVATVGLIVLLQCMSFGMNWLYSVAFGFLIAAELHKKSCAYTSPHHNFVKKRVLPFNLSIDMKNKYRSFVKYRTFVSFKKSKKFQKKSR